MSNYLQNLLFKLGENPYCNYFLQRLAHLGDFTLTDKVRQILQPQTGEKVLDMGCGLGLYSRLPGFYVGVDISEPQLRFAQRHFSKNGKKYFVLADIKEVEFVPKSFDKTICIWVMHHLNDEDSLKLLAKLAYATKEKVLFIDRVRPDINSSFGERFFFRYLEKGNYMRTLEDSLKLIERNLKVLRVEIVQNRTRTGKSALIPCIPK